MPEKFPLQKVKFLDIHHDFPSQEACFVCRHCYGKRVCDAIHWHDFHELVVVENGEGEHILRDGNYRIYPGDAFLIKTGEPHGYANMKHLTLLNICYRPQFLGAMLDEISPTLGYRHFFEMDPQLPADHRFQNRRSLSPKSLRSVLACAWEMMDEQKHQANGYRFMLKLNLMKILCIIGRTFEPQSFDSSATREITQLISYMNQHYAKPLTLAELANFCHKSPRGLLRLFRAAIHQSPISYLLNIRLTKAAAELRSTQDAISKIAAHCGFHDSNYFSRLFLRQFGSCPREYRQQHQSLSGNVKHSR